jgi:hypothetical protein
VGLEACPQMMQMFADNGIQSGNLMLSRFINLYLRESATSADNQK